MRPRVAFFDLACCEGCQLQLLNTGEVLLDVLGLVDLVEFREAMSERWNGPLDAAFVEGSVTDEHAAERLRGIRARARVLVALGSCATIGGVNGMRNTLDLAEARRHVYGAGAGHHPTGPTRPLDQVVPVDYQVPGCPVYPPELLAVVKCVVQGIPYAVPDAAVCTECQRRENVCLYDRGVTCLGPVTRAGCGAWCVGNGNVCCGCRGLVSNPNEQGMLRVLAAHGVSLEQVVQRLELYNRCRAEGAGGG